MRMNKDIGLSREVHQKLKIISAEECRSMKAIVTDSLDHAEKLKRLHSNWERLSQEAKTELRLCGLAPKNEVENERGDAINHLIEKTKSEDDDDASRTSNPISQ